MKLRTVNLILLTMLLSLVTSCKDEKKEPTPAPSQTTTQTNAKVNEDSIKVNPAHGLPGHRCDLPVGAPLDGTNATTTTKTTQPQSTTVSPIRVDQTPDINPPHGEPHHDCTIPVGAKLKK